MNEATGVQMLNAGDHLNSQLIGGLKILLSFKFIFFFKSHLLLEALVAVLERILQRGAKQLHDHYTENFQPLKS